MQQKTGSIQADEPGRYNFEILCELPCVCNVIPSIKLRIKRVGVVTEQPGQGYSSIRMGKQYCKRKLDVHRPSLGLYKHAGQPAPCRRHPLETQATVLERCSNRVDSHKVVCLISLKITLQNIRREVSLNNTICRIVQLCRIILMACLVVNLCTIKMRVEVGGLQLSAELYRRF